MIYDYTCGECQHTFEVRGVRVDDREGVQECPSCGGPAEYDAMSTMRGARTTVQPDLVSYMESKFGRSPTWQGPTSVGSCASSSSARRGPGAQRVMPGAPGTRKAEV